MMRVRCIFVETTVPVRIRPRIETSPVNGHFLSINPPSVRYDDQNTLNVLDGG